MTGEPWVDAALWRACAESTEHMFGEVDGRPWCAWCGGSDPYVPCRTDGPVLTGITDVKPTLYERFETWYWQRITRPIARAFRASPRWLLDGLDGWTMRKHAAVDDGRGGLVCRLERLPWPCAAWDDASTRRAARRPS